MRVHRGTISARLVGGYLRKRQLLWRLLAEAPNSSACWYVDRLEKVSSLFGDAFPAECVISCGVTDAQRSTAYAVDQGGQDVSRRERSGAGQSCGCRSCG